MSSASPSQPRRTRVWGVVGGGGGSGCRLDFGVGPHIRGSTLLGPGFQVNGFGFRWYIRVDGSCIGIQGLHSGMWQTVWIPTVAPVVKNALKLQASIPGSALGGSTLHTTSSTVSQASMQEHRTLAPAMNNVLQVRRARLQRQNPHISGLPAIFHKNWLRFWGAGVWRIGVGDASLRKKNMEMEWFCCRLQE